MGGEAATVFIISLPAEGAERAAPLLPEGFAPAGAPVAAPEFRFGVSELREFIGLAKDLAELATALVGVLAALRAAGIIGKVGVRAATAAEPVELDTGMDEAAVRAKLGAASGGG